MPPRIHFVTAALALAISLLSGCSLSPAAKRAGGGSGSAQRNDAALADYSSSAVKARTESHAHYAAAILYEQSDEPALAVEEFYQAAMADPSNETIVLEATSRLLRFRQEDKPGDATVKMREKSVEILKKATAQRNASSALFARLGLVYSMMGKKDLAIDANRKAIKKAPGSILGYQYLAQLYLQINRVEEGLK